VPSGGGHSVHLLRQRATPGDLGQHVADEVATGSVRANDANNSPESGSTEGVTYADTRLNDRNDGDSRASATMAANLPESGSPESGPIDVDAATRDPVAPHEPTQVTPGWVPEGGHSALGNAPVSHPAQAAPRRETRFSRYTLPMLQAEEIGFTFNFAGLDGRPSARVKLESSTSGSRVHISTHDATLFDAMIDSSERLDSDIVIDGERGRAA
jgi:hypothetical protein